MSLLAENEAAIAETNGNACRGDVDKLLYSRIQTVAGDPSAELFRQNWRMSRYESGIHEPPYQFVEAISRVLQVPAAFFYCPDDRLAEIIRLYGELSEDDRSDLYGLAVERSLA